MEINEIIKRIRVDKHLTQKEVAQNLGVLQGVYQKMEFGRTEITFTRLQELANIFGMSVTDIINYPNVVGGGDSEEIERLKKENEKLKNYLLEMSDVMDICLSDIDIAVEMFGEIEEDVLKQIFDVALDKLAKDERDEEMQEICKIAKTYKEEPLNYFHANYWQAIKIQGKLLRILKELLPK